MVYTKTFIQLREYDFCIELYVGITGNIRKSSNIIYYGEYRRQQQSKRGKEYYKENKESIDEKHRKYNKTDEGRIAIRRRADKRKRNLGYKPMNKPFDNSEGHHLNYEDVLFIPKKVHSSIAHSVTRDRNMKEINDAAFNWLCTQERL